MEWKEYEEEIYSKLNQEFGKNCKITLDTKVNGKFSKVKRQVDVLIESTLVGYPLLGVVECKCFSKKVDVKIVDSFIGFLEDVGANLGIIITNIGYSKAAHNRAEMKGIRLEILTFEEFEDYSYDLEFCQICQPDMERLGGIIDFSDSYVADIEGIAYIFELGTCDYCGRIHIKCESCGSIIPIEEYQYGEYVECYCGINYLIDLEYDRDNLPSIVVDMKVQNNGK